jgi:hypothetical protein
MKKQNPLARVLAIIGTVLVALPLVFPLATSLPSIGSPGGYRVDYLMPFELYPITLIGTALILWASLRAHMRRAAVARAIGAMLGFFILCAIAAQVTGIANSVEQLEKWRYMLTAGLGVASLLGQVALIVVGVLLVRDLFATRG